MKMAAASQNALLAFALIFVILGGLIGSPDGRLFALAISGLCAIAVLFCGSTRTRRILSLLLLAAVILQAIPAWREHRNARHFRRPGANAGAGQMSQPADR